MPRVLLRSLLALVVTAGAALTAWRVLAPAEVLSAATEPYPALAVRAPGVIGRLNMAPLIVDDRIRVYGSKRQVRADGPADAKTVMTARWSFRRWPEQLAGVVASGTTVVSRWSDGELVAIDARTGSIAWRSPGPAAPDNEGHRTGAATTWAPPGLHMAAGTVVVSGAGSLTGIDASTGARRWRTEVPANCTDGFTTAGGAYVCPTGVYDVATGSTAWASGTAAEPVGAGPYTPLGCDVAASNCAAVRDSAGKAWLVSTATPQRSAALDLPGSIVAGSVVLPPYPDAQLLGESKGNLVLLRANRHLAVIDPRTSAVIAEFPPAVGTERLTWNPGRWQVTDEYVAIERLAADGPADPEEPGHYFTTETVIIAAL